MTIEERLDRLTERHEALTQTVEIIASMQRANEERFAESERRFERRFEKITDILESLIEIVKQHEIRLNGLQHPPS